MNSRSVSDNLVNFSTDLATTLNQLDSKEPLLSFPFDHLYACSESGDRRQTLHLKEVEISTHCVLPHQDKQAQRVASLETQNKKLKDLLIYHLDLIQQQNELMSKRDKAFQALKLENDELKSKVSQAGVEHKVVLGNHGIDPPPLHIPDPPTESSIYKTDLLSSTWSQPYSSSHNEMVLMNQSTAASDPYVYDPAGSDSQLDPFGIEDEFPELPDVSTFLTCKKPPEVAPPAFNMIDNKRSKKEPKVTEPNDEPKYTVITSSGTSKISRNRKRSTGIGSFSRMQRNKSTTSKQEKSTIYDDDIFSVNKQSKMTYGKSKSRYGYTALQERLRLIDPTPTGEDPYQLGEAEMREQSPIPKLMLQKANHGRMRVYPETGSVTSTITSTTSSRRIYDTMSSMPSTSSKSKRSKSNTSTTSITEDCFSATNMHVQSKKDNETSLGEESELDVEKTDSEIDWRIFTTNKPKETSLCDFSYGETSANLVNVPLDITKMEFTDFFEPSPANAESSNTPGAETVQSAEKSRKRGARAFSLAGPLDDESLAEAKRTGEPKRKKKRTLSTTAPVKRTDNTQQKVPAKPRARRATRAKKTPVPGMTTNKPYHTSLGDPDLSWYLGLDPDIKKEDCDPTDNASSNVEVPRWRVKIYSPSHDSEGIENLDDKVFEKRHQKYEAEERRQLRWHMRRIREQKHVERLRQRQRDPWGPNSAPAHPRGDHTVWPQPVRDIQFIEITDTLPVTSFGEEVPNLPESNFVLPWVRSSKAPKKMKRSKTLH